MDDNTDYSTPDMGYDGVTDITGVTPDSFSTPAATPTPAATASSSNWLAGLQSLLTTGASVYSTVTNQQTAAQKQAAANQAATLAAQTKANTGNSFAQYLPWVAGLAAVVAVAFFFFKRKGK